MELSRERLGPKNNQNRTIEISWTQADDLFDDEILYSLFYSPDGGTTWNLLSDDLTEMNFTWDTTTVSNGNEYLLKVIPRCSANIGEETVSDVFTIYNNPPSATPPESTIPPPTTPFFSEREWMTLIQVLGLVIVLGFGGIMVVGMRKLRGN